jgi:hypothetical protein
MKDNIFGWDRRLFVGGAAVLAAASFYVAAVGRGALKACNHEPIEGDLSSDLQSLIRIGKSYLNEHAKNGKLDFLDEVLFDETETWPANIVHIQRRLLAIDHKIRDEFARCETVICDGWVLAKSEAGLCAMIAMQHLS